MRVVVPGLLRDVENAGYHRSNPLRKPTLNRRQKLINNILRLNCNRLNFKDLPGQVDSFFRELSGTVCDILVRVVSADLDAFSIGGLFITVLCYHV